MFGKVVKGIKARFKRTWLLSSFCDKYCILIDGKPYYFNCGFKMMGKKSATPTLYGVSLEYAKPQTESNQ
ncbi:hypothetical protein TDB9533_00419 [Thalassocella blandensis]|nr:hypothetical protein TDB9533_00419 [Thalassocella blandensis]